MSKNYELIIKNLKEYIENKHNFIIPEKKFNIDDGQFGKKIPKNKIQKEKEINSIDWIQNFDIYYSENTFLNEKVMLGRYTGDDSKKSGGYVIINTANVSEILNTWIAELAVEREIDLGIFLYMFYQKENAPLINRLISKESIEDILDIKYSDYEANHDYNEILKLFVPMFMFKINDEYLNLNDGDDKYRVINIEQFKYRFLGLINCNDKLENINREVYFTEECIEEYLKVFKQEVNNFPYENLYFSLCHNSPKFIFLEVYRMIEKLYPIIFYYHFKKDFGVNNITILEMQQKMQGKLKIRHREKDAIFYLFEYCQENKKIQPYINNINIYKNYIDKSNKDITIDKWIYKIRNTAVHLSFDNKKDVDINKILREDNIVKILIPMVVELYNSILN